MEFTRRAEEWLDWATQLEREGSQTPLPQLVEAVDEGVYLRRHAIRLADLNARFGRNLEQILPRLQAIELSRLTAETGGDATDESIRESTERRLVNERMELEELTTSAEIDPQVLGTVLSRFRLDALELGERIAWLDGTQHSGHVSSTTQMELERIRDVAESLVDLPIRPETLRLQDRCRRISRKLLILRIDRLLTPPILPGNAPEAHWRRRFQLTRARAEMLEAIGPARVAPPDVEGDDLLGHLRPGLEARREQLAKSAIEAMETFSLAERFARWEELTGLARGEAQEVLALAEDAPLIRAVPLLEGTVADLEQLARDLRSEARQARVPSQPFNRARLRDEARSMERLARTLRGEWQEKSLSLRMTRIFGERFASLFDGIVLVLILVMTGLIIVEGWLDFTGQLGRSGLHFFAWADLAICLLFLTEFTLKLSLAPRRWLYFRRHALIDLLPSIPFGFIAYQLTASPALERIQLLRLLRLPRLIRFIRVARPLVRVFRLVIFLFRFVDRLIRRYAVLFNRNIILFEPTPDRELESRVRHLYVKLWRDLDRRMNEFESTIDPVHRLALVSRNLDDLAAWIGWQGVRPIQPEQPPRAGRDITAERAVERLIELTPDELLEQMGPDFAISVDRLIQLFDVQPLRRIPVIRELVAHREKGPAESTALAANYLGYAILRVLDWIYFVADLQATVSPPLFLDKLGRTLVNATRRPAYRLLTFGLLFAGLWAIVNSFVPRPSGNRLGWLSRIAGLVHDLVQWTSARLGPAVIGLGAVCLVLLLIGQWLRKIANQAAEFCERVVEAQFASQTKALKRRSQTRDLAFIVDRVSNPELKLRTSDDVQTVSRGSTADIEPVPAAFDSLEVTKALRDSEAGFIHLLRFLYSDFLDGPPFHRTDTKSSTQLLGNLAIQNLSRSSLAYLLSEEKRVQRLDMSRSASSLFGGPYLWFDYINRLIVQQTARLLVDYNRHAVPIERLSCSPESVRTRYVSWLSSRLSIAPSEVELPPLRGHRSRQSIGQVSPARPEAKEFFETVGFTAVDFLSHDPIRDDYLRRQYGAQVVDLLARDREHNLRQAFRSFPLHLAPASRRTFNAFYLYEAYLAKGRVVLLPFRFTWLALRGLVFVAGRVVHIVREILNPRPLPEPRPADDSYAAALRKIHRMRKPAFMESLWMRARFDVEYLGVALPDIPVTLPQTSLLEHDLDFIGASRHERVMAEQFRESQRRKVKRVATWLHQMGLLGQALEGVLREELPFLVERSGEVVRALVAATVIDHDDLYSLGSSIDGLRRVFAHAARPENRLESLPENLPEPIVSSRLLWHPNIKSPPPVQSLLELPCFPDYPPDAQKRILRALRIHRGVTRGWIRILQSQGGTDPIAVLRERLMEVALRTDLWSEQILTLRMVQTLTMLDLQHYAELVWELGGYASLAPTRGVPELPTSKKPCMPN